ncbi:MAG: preprotein translocase subunit SecE [Elusimicrobia bacterium]|nr:preprotein translocase subunit SecE [Elusimicrobiota bacterium]MDE2314284.1 preprotein translocase subunit SecE [Elusimicrobiota bacterium]
MNFAIQFVREAYFELKKSSWLTRREAADSTRVVVLLVVVLSLYIAGVDFLLHMIMGSILGG